MGHVLHAAWHRMAIISRSTAADRRRSTNGGTAVAEECRAFGVEAECFIADVSSFEACEAMTKAVKERFGSIDVLVNNAGITKDGLLVRMTEEQFDSVTSVNYKSVFNMTRHGLARL